MKCLRKLFNKPKKYKYVESPAVKKDWKVNTCAQSHGCKIGDSQMPVVKTGNKFKNQKDILIVGADFIGGELSCFFEDCEDIVIEDCTFSGVKSDNGHALLFYRCHNVIIKDCEFVNLRLGNSESLAINSGCTDFKIHGNTFHNIDNLPLDVIAGERDSEYTGRVEIYDNKFTECGYRNDYWTAAGPYVDGASDVIIRNNYIDCRNKDGVNSALGIEIGAENNRTAKNIVVRDNEIIGARKHGIIYGSYKKKFAGVKNVLFSANTFADCANDYEEQYNCVGVVIK